MALPKDPNILLSYVNTQLRDNYPSLEALCSDMQVSPEYRRDMEEKLDSIGYAYSEAANSFVRIIK